jgi:phenylpyruvate tautomerase PptA (4-oxalocrotonate tautomerase family)
VNNRIVEGQTNATKDENAMLVSASITEVAKIPRENVWVVFEDVSSDAWYVGGDSVTRLRQQQE